MITATTTCGTSRFFLDEVSLPGFWSNAIAATRKASWTLSGSSRIPRHLCNLSGGSGCEKQLATRTPHQLACLVPPDPAGRKLQRVRPAERSKLPQYNVARGNDRFWHEAADPECPLVGCYRG